MMRQNLGCREDFPSFTLAPLTLWSETEKTEKSETEKRCPIANLNPNLTYKLVGLRNSLEGKEAAGNQIFIHCSVYFHVAHIYNTR